MMHDALLRCFEKIWHTQPSWFFFLKPLSGFYRQISRRRYLATRKTLRSTCQVQIWLVCNIVLGGAGKSPLVVALYRWARDRHGLRCAMVVGGYKSRVHDLHVVQDGDDVSWVGDEAKMLYERTGGLVVVCRDRQQAVSYIQAHHADVQLIFLDDGLQNARTSFHRALLVEKRCHNQNVLPLGPFRNVYSDVAHLIDQRLGVHDVSMYAADGKYHQIHRRISGFMGAEKCMYDRHFFSGRRVHAVAGIGDPQQFFDALRALKMTIIPHVYANHGTPPSKWFSGGDGLPVITTHKDAVKLATLPTHVYVAVLEVVLPDGLQQVLDAWL